MSSSLNGVPGSRGAPIAPAPPAEPVGPVRAIVRVTPAAPAQDIGSRETLSRSGLSLETLLGTEDLLEARTPVRDGATAMGLSQARTALLRQMPGDALAALDDVWSGAQRSEEGWYLRAGALTVLGLPGEGDRIASEGLAQRPTSVALRFLQSVARSVTGDWAGARAALAGALDAAPRDPVLRLQQAVVLGRQGHLADANEIVAEVQQQAPEHPALDWARSILRVLTADRARGEALQTVRTATGEFAMADADDVLPEAAPDIPVPEPVTQDDAVAWSPLDGGDLVENAFASLGARIVRRADGLPTADMRVLMRALSTGGTLAGSCTPEQAHAARTLLGQLIDAARQLEISTVVRPTPSVGLAALLGALRRDEHGEATRLWRRSSVAVPTGARRLMQALLDGARSMQTEQAHPADASASGSASRNASEGESDAVLSPSLIVRRERDDGLLLPVRFGLSLLADTSDEAWSTDAAVIVDGEIRRALWSTSSPAFDARLAGLPVTGLATPSRGTVDADGLTPRGEATGLGWGGARATHGLLDGTPAHAHDTEGSGVRIAAVLCVALAVGASVLGFNAVAIALAAGAVWLGMRRSTRGSTRGSAKGGS